MEHDSLARLKDSYYLVLSGKHRKKCDDISGIWESEKRYAKTKGMIPETGASCMGHDGKHGEMKQNGRDE